MAKNTKIEWCDHTFNPWIGCTKVSPGCAHCYAEKLDVRFGGGHWGKGAPRKRTRAANWKQPLRWNEQPWRNHPDPEVGFRRHRVFCASLADWLDDEVPIEWLADLLRLIRRTPNLDWLLLTKRPENFWKRMSGILNYTDKVTLSLKKREACLNNLYSATFFTNDWLAGEFPKNVLIGTTVENQDMADKRIPELLKIPARVRFLSCEPLLEPVDLEMALENFQPLNPDLSRKPAPVNWIICGGESGPNARPMNPDWARSLRDQCKAAGVPFLFKQWGEWWPAGHAICENKDMIMLGHEAMYKIGKRAAGRLLDGVEHNEFPEVKGAHE